MAAQFRTAREGAINVSWGSGNSITGPYVRTIATAPAGLVPAGATPNRTAPKGTAPTISRADMVSANRGSASYDVANVGSAPSYCSADYDSPYNRTGTGSDNGNSSGYGRTDVNSAGGGSDSHINGGGRYRSSSVTVTTKGMVICKNAQETRGQARYSADT